MFIVRGTTADLDGTIYVVRDTRKDALETANDFLAQDMPIVTIENDGRIYTMAEFALTFIDLGTDAGTSGNDRS
jgi:hypothetical protein